MKKPVYYVILALLVGVFLFAAYKVGSYYLEKYRSDKVISEANRFVTLPGDSDNNDPTQDPSGDPECPTVQFDELLKTNGDVIAWIYGANTHINYPVVQGSDNDYYLRHLLDGTWNDNGSIFMDCANSADFSDQNSLIYGHNMTSGAMFSNLVKYKQQQIADCFYRVLQERGQEVALYRTADASFESGERRSDEFKHLQAAIDAVPVIEEAAQVLGSDVLLLGSPTYYGCVSAQMKTFCPHAAIRPVLLTEEEKAQVPAGFVTAPAKGLGKDASAYAFRMQVSPYDCLGCGVCLTACPAKGALTMAPFEEMKAEQPLFDQVAMDEKYLKKDVISDKSVKSAQFAKPYFQFSAACAGCAETTYIKLLSQLFGDHMYVGNAAGCSSAISGGAPILPYCKDCQGHGPAWEHSLFEDNAEFAYGFFHAQDAIRKELLLRLDAIKSAGIAAEAVEAYQNGWNKHESSRAVTDALLAALEKAQQTEDVKYILENRAYLAKKSIWAVGGDGWAYDIGFGGIDHVMAQNRDVNLLVLDTEVYSNTGGQASKATPTSATAKFAAGGKQVAKKDLGGILMQYGYVYVAQVAMGADQAQTLRALREAESYDGPSIVICYCPCLEQHIKAGMGNSQLEMKKAVECGYWHLYRYDPRRIAEGKNPFQLDSPEPDTDKLMDFLMGENRFASLKNNFPEKADALYAKEITDVKARYAKYKKMAQD